MGESNSKRRYRTIGPKALDEHIGDRGAMYLSVRNRGGRHFTKGRIDYNAEGDFCLATDRQKIAIEHGETIRIHTIKGMTDYVFIDESD